MTETSHGATDLGRRIREHRSRAGLSTKETATRAGMAETYLDYLESAPEAAPTPGALTRLASALGTSRPALAGAGVDRPPGQQPAHPHPVLESLTRRECREYLGSGGIGRFVFDDTRGPVATPVNFRMLGDDIVFRTSIWSSAAHRAMQRSVSFEVDYIDEAFSEGWSVLASGRAHLVVEAAEVAEVARLHVRPWAGGKRETYIRITVAALTGRRIRAR